MKIYKNLCFSMLSHIQLRILVLFSLKAFFSDVVFASKIQKNKQILEDLVGNSQIGPRIMTFYHGDFVMVLNSLHIYRTSYNQNNLVRKEHELKIILEAEKLLDIREMSSTFIQIACKSQKDCQTTELPMMMFNRKNVTCIALINQENGIFYMKTFNFERLQDGVLESIKWSQKPFTFFYETLNFPNQFGLVMEDSSVIRLNDSLVSFVRIENITKLMESNQIRQLQNLDIPFCFQYFPNSTITFQIKEKFFHLGSISEAMKIPKSENITSSNPFLVNELKHKGKKLLIKDIFVIKHLNPSFKLHPVDGEGGWSWLQIIGLVAVIGIIILIIYCLCAYGCCKKVQKSLSTSSKSSSKTKK